VNQYANKGARVVISKCPFCYGKFITKKTRKKNRMLTRCENGCYVIFYPEDRTSCPHQDVFSEGWKKTKNPAILTRGCRFCKWREFFYRALAPSMSGERMMVETSTGAEKI
jgi:hypothetical protein